MRRRDPARLDALIAAATSVFVERGFARAKVHQIADRASIGPGTVYLYARDKDALFELAVLRSLESPAVADPTLPYRAHATGPAQKAAFRKAIEAIVHFPQLWVSLGRREVSGVAEEYAGILLEIADWVVRYHGAVALVEANRTDWPVLNQLLDELVWRELERHLTAYLKTRMQTGHLAAVGDAEAVARFTLEALVGFLAIGAVGSTRWQDGPGRARAGLAARLLAAGLVRPRSGDGLPLPPEPGH